MTTESIKFRLFRMTIFLTYLIMQHKWYISYMKKKTKGRITIYKTQATAIWTYILAFGHIYQHLDTYNSIPRDMSSQALLFCDKLRIVRVKKHRQMKLHCLQKVQIWAFESLVHQINSLQVVLKLKQKFKKQSSYRQNSVLCDRSNLYSPFYWS